MSFLWACRPAGWPTEGPFGQANHKDFCANNDGAVRNSSGFHETWANNRCILGHPGSPTAVPYLYNRCDASSTTALAATSDHTFGNTFYLDGSADALPSR